LSVRENPVDYSNLLGPESVIMNYSYNYVQSERPLQAALTRPHP